LFPAETSRLCVCVCVSVTPDTVTPEHTLFGGRIEEHIDVSTHTRAASVWSASGRR